MRASDIESARVGPREPRKGRGGRRLAPWGAVAGLLLLAACAADPAAEIAGGPPLPPLAHEMKGWELYPLPSSACLGVWNFALLPGTNRLKTEGEIRGEAESFDRLLGTLARLPRGEQVFWRSMPGVVGGPPEEVVARIRAAAAAGGVSVEGGPPR